MYCTSRSTGFSGTVALALTLALSLSAGLLIENTLAIEGNSMIFRDLRMKQGRACPGRRVTYVLPSSKFSSLGLLLSSASL